MPPLIGGVSISSKRLYDNLKLDGYDVSYYNLKFKNMRFNNALGIIMRFAFIPIYILLHKRYDVIHCHVPGIYRKLYLGMCRFLYKKAYLIMTIHGDITTLLTNKISIYALNRADRIICVQPGDSLKVPLAIRRKCIDIPAFIIPTRISAENIPIQVLKFVHSDDVPLVIFNGGIVLSDKFYDLYGFKDIIALYKRLSEENIRCKLLIIVNNNVLNSEQYNFLHALKESTKNDQNVLWVIYEKFELIPLFRYSHLYIRPTKTDGDSLSVREALAMGCVTIASDKAKRPMGTLVYHTEEELFELTKKVLLNEIKPMSKVISKADFYKQIKEQYEYCR